MSARDDSIPVPLLKRVCDVGISIALLIVFSPIWISVLVILAASLGIRPEDRGPLLYRERRISAGREFDLLKFRVLRTEVLERMSQEGGYARIYEADTTNLTWAGRRLLKPLYLDELPQVINIVRGDMCLVGPRPWPVSMVREQVASGYEYRELVRAGWTGPVQVQKGRPEPGGPPTLDLEYVEACRTWSSWRLVRYDLGILAETVKVLARGQGLRF